MSGGGKLDQHVYLASVVSRRGDSPMVQGYCVKCRAKREISNAVAVKLKNGKPAMKGKCPVCGTTIMRIGAAK
jgi:DNA polymerase II large subunit